MSQISVRVRKGTSAHYFSVFDGITPIASGEVKNGTVTYNAPCDDATITAAVKAECAKVDADVGPLLARLSARRAAKARLEAMQAKTDPAPAEEPKSAPKTAASKKGGR